MTTLMNALETVRRKVLIVEDHPEWIAILTGILEGDFSVVSTIARVDELIAEAIRLQPDVVTLDVSLTGGSGLMALHDLRAALPLAIIVIVSTTVTKLYRQEAWARGANAYVSKSGAMQELLPAIAAAPSR